LSCTRRNRSGNLISAPRASGLSLYLSRLGEGGARCARRMRDQQQGLFDRLERSGHIAQEVGVPKANHAEALSFQVARAHGVLLDPFKMLSAVQFDDQPAFATVLKSAIYGPIGTCRRNLKPAQRRPLSLFQSACSGSVWVRRKVLEQSQVFRRPIHTGGNDRSDHIRISMLKVPHPRVTAIAEKSNHRATPPSPNLVGRGNNQQRARDLAPGPFALWSCSQRMRMRGAGTSSSISNQAQPTLFTCSSCSRI
jgi:hypothetical protein